MKREDDICSIILIVTVVCMALILLWSMALSNRKIAVKDTVNKIVFAEEIPTKEPITAIPTAEPTEEPYISMGIFKLTAYCACSFCCGKSDGITATGTQATSGRTIAVDPGVIPYGTEVIINGHAYVAEDCGGAINGNAIDIYMESHEKALEHGVQYAEVLVSNE